MPFWPSNRLKCALRKYTAAGVKWSWNATYENNKLIAVQWMLEQTISDHVWSCDLLWERSRCNAFGLRSRQLRQQLNNRNIRTWDTWVIVSCAEADRCAAIGGFVVPGRERSGMEHTILICLLPSRDVWCKLALRSWTHYCHMIHQT